MSAQPATQTVPTIALSHPVWKYGDEFSSIESVRELSDGRILVTDRKELRIVVLNPRSTRGREIGRRGSGPGEYGSLGPLWPLRGDTTLIQDFSGRRILALDGDRFVATRGPGDPQVAAVGRGELLGSYPNGDLLVEQRSLGDWMTDSGQLVRVPRGGGATIAIARVAPLNAAGIMYAAAASGPTERELRIPGLAGLFGATGRGGATGRVGAPGRAPVQRTHLHNMTIGAPDEARIFPDGWVAIARARPYRIDWCSGRGCVTGPVLEDRVPMTTQDRLGYLAHLRIRGEPGPRRLEETGGWPIHRPAFTGGIEPVVMTAPDGNLLIHRFTPADTVNNMYEMIDRRGRVVLRIRTPLRQRIVGFGPRSVYVANVDSDGLLLLDRRTWAQR